jgi:hypothetical protein
MKDLGFLEIGDSYLYEPSLLNTNDTLQIIPLVLLYYIQEHYMIGKFGYLNIKIDITTHLRNIRLYTN